MRNHDRAVRHALWLNAHIRSCPRRADCILRTAVVMSRSLQWLLRNVVQQPSPIISLCDVYKAFGDTRVMNGLSLDIYPGTSTVIMGESGSGKSVLIRLMNGLTVPDSGSVTIFGVNTATAPYTALRDARLRTSTLFQNYALLDSRTVEENIAFPLTETGRSTPRAARPAVIELLQLLGLSGTENLLPSELSGGMKKRVGLARALITEPEVIFFDEPTTGLDPVMIELVDEMLLGIRERFGVTMVIISHDMASAFKLGDRLAMLEGGTISFIGAPDEARASCHPAVPRFDGAATSRLSAAPGSAARPPAADAQALADAPEQDHPPASTGLQWQDLPVPAHAPVVEVRDLCKDFSGRSVLRGVNFWVEPGVITTLIGGSGSGKTVMMKHILGLFQPTSGSVTVFGQNLASLSEQQRLHLRLKFGMLFQGAALFDSMTIAENVAFPLVESPGRERLSPSKARQRALLTLERLRIADLADRMPSDISGGQRKRAGLARAIVTEPDLMIYDEPTTGLDPVMTAYVNDMIVEAQREFGTTTLVVSHDMASTFRISHTVAMLADGEIVAFGSPDDIRASTNPIVQRFIFADELGDSRTSAGASTHPG